jgi:predicted component of type VI protein secretion system
MLDPVAVALKFGFLLVLYLFLLWVARSGLRDLRRTNLPAEGPPAADATGLYTASSGLAPDADGDPRLVVDKAPGHEPGMSYEVGDGATLGRGNVEIRLEDPFASSRHARLVREGPVIVLEDLGSTNGTYLNGEALDGPQPLHPGDRIRIGDSEFTFAS